MNDDIIKRKSADVDKSTKDLVKAQTAKILELVPNVIDQYAHDIEISGNLLKHISGDNLVNPSPVLKDARSINDFLKRTDIIKVQLLKAVGLIAPVAANVQVQQTFSQNNVNILDPSLFSALGGFLDLGDDEEDSNTNNEFVARSDVIEAETIEVTD
jgi:hypothetical protein